MPDGNLRDKLDGLFQMSTRKGPMLFSPLRGYEPKRRIDLDGVISVGFKAHFTAMEQGLRDLVLLHSHEPLATPAKQNPFEIEIKNPSRDMELFGFMVGDSHFLASDHRLHINQSPDGKQHDQAVFISDIFNDNDRPQAISIGGRDGGMLMGCMGVMILGRNRTTGKVDFIGTHSSRYSDIHAEMNPYNPIFHLREFVATHDEVKVYCATSFTFGSLMSGVLKEYQPEQAREILTKKLDHIIPADNIFDSNGFVFFPKLGVMVKGSYDQALRWLQKISQLLSDAADCSRTLGV